MKKGQPHIYAEKPTLDPFSNLTPIHFSHIKMTHFLSTDEINDLGRRLGLVGMNKNALKPSAHIFEWMAIREQNCLKELQDLGGMTLLE